MRSRLGKTPSSPSSLSNQYTSFTPDDVSHHSHHNDIDFDDGPSIADDSNKSRGNYRVYRKRWLMLFYLSLLNLLSDWTGLSVAPIATLTSRAYGSDDDYIYANDNNVQMYIQPEALVTVFLVASSFGTAFEPWILGRLGLRRTIVFGAFSNMLGNLVKSGGLPPFFTINIMLHGIHGTCALYVGFFLVGFAQPLFQCTPALLSASWFPEEERTLATSIALNANQLGVGLAFIVGALYVQSPSQIASYFGLISLFSVVAFVGTALHLDDAPPTPPSGSSRIMKGTLEISVKDLIEKASSSMLVRDPNCGKYDFDVAKLWGYCGSNEDIKSDSGALSASAKSLLRRHISRKDEHVQLSASQRDPSSQSILASPYSIDSSSHFGDYEGAEPTLTQTPHHLEIDIRDDQVLLAAKACLSRNGFSHALVVFTAAGLVINVMSTYLDYLVRGNYFGAKDTHGNIAGQTSSAAIYVAVIGALFQVIIMISSIVVGSLTDKTKSYFMITIVLSVLGVFALAECGVSLDEDRDGNVRWSMLLVAGLLGPLLPVTTELAVELAYPLSENTVLVILQLSCNLFSALFIPMFNAVRDVGVATDTETGNDGKLDDDGAAFVLGSGRPPYTFSFYLLILICSASAVYFATFNGKYLRLEAEMKNRGNNTAQQPLVSSL